MIEFKLPKINQYQAIAVFELPKVEGVRKGRVIVVERPDHMFDKFVVAFHYESDDEWHQGAYLRTFSDALAEFNRRIQLAF